VFSGVRHGIEDGGNKSGIPTVNGSIVFDDRYSGKPLVYCGTGGIMPYSIKGRNSWEKKIDNGDLIIMAGGRVGKDGIHGATFSSIELNENSPQSAVQIGSPITQKLLSDFLQEAVDKGYIKCSTDNGAGGLSSSIGELARLSGGAEVYLEKVPLKYSNLKPWEIFISESQERMTLVIEESVQDQLFQLAKDREVELTLVGKFTDSGYLDVRYQNTVVAYLDMEFLHEGVPEKIMQAEWRKPELHEPEINVKDYNTVILSLLGSYNICSREVVIRQYDHEVKGKTIIKPLMGKEGKAPQDAAVMRIDHKKFTGIAISNGLLPRYGDIDPYQMSAGAFDEAVRQILAVGGKLPEALKPSDIFWSCNDNFCVPDSAYHPEKNPDGKLKLAKLVQMAQALFDMSTYFSIPMTSGKDSMKNDFKAGDAKISVPPTILYSLVAKIEDVRKTTTAEFKMPGDLIYILGTTYNELGGSEFYQLFGELGENVPKVRREKVKTLYRSLMKAQEERMLESCHDISDGGTAVALAESSFGGGLGAEIFLDGFDDLPLNAILFSESHSRFIVSVKQENQQRLEELFPKTAIFLGKVRNDQRFLISKAEEIIIDLEVNDLLQAWERDLEI
jgi:phosphoribosylformylglycinamidine synthase